MKRPKIYLPVAALILTSAAAAAAEQPSCASNAPGCFKGIIVRGQDLHDVLPPGATSVAIHTTATGTGTHLGQFSLIREIIGNLLTFAATGSAQWVAANGDKIYTTIDGSAQVSPDYPGFLLVTETHYITGGTGRFTGIHGKFEVVLLHDFRASSVSGNVESHDLSGWFQGTVTLPGPAR